MPRWPKKYPLTPEQSKLAADNYPLVLFAVRRYWGYDTLVSEIQDDAISEGYLALVKAARAYKPDRISPKTGKTVKFSTYAMRSILREVYRAAQTWKRKTYTPDHSLLAGRYSRIRFNIDED